MKYSLSPQEIPQALPSGFPIGSGYISLYIPPLVTIQIQYIVFKFQFIVPEWDKSPFTKCPPLSDFSQAWISLDILYQLTMHHDMCRCAHLVQHTLSSTICALYNLWPGSHTSWGMGNCFFFCQKFWLTAIFNISQIFSICKMAEHKEKKCKKKCWFNIHFISGLITI